MGSSRVPWPAISRSPRGARAHEESRPRGQADPLERGGVVEGAALGAVAVVLQAHVQVVVAQLGGRAVILLDGLRLGVVVLVLLLVRGVLVVRVVVVLVVIVGVVVSFVVEVEVLVVERGLVDVVSELGAGARHCGRSHGVPFAWAGGQPATGYGNPLRHSRQPSNCSVYSPGSPHRRLSTPSSRSHSASRRGKPTTTGVAGPPDI